MPDNKGMSKRSGFKQNQSNDIANVRLAGQSKQKSECKVFCCKMLAQGGDLTPTAGRTVQITLAVQEQKAFGERVGGR